MDSSKPAEALVEFASTLAYDDIPAGVIATAKRMILDTLGCALAATSLGDGCRETIAVMRGLGGRQESTIFGFGTKVAAPHAAFANGALVHALNYDPIGREIGHMGVVCLAAPLAMAEARGGVSGREFLAASVAACEVCARVTAAIARTGRQASEKFLAGQLLSYFGAAAGAGRALSLDRAEMHSAFGLALMQMSGSRQIVLRGDPPAKAIYGAFPNQAGVLAALLAKAGLRADCDVFGEPAGLYSMIYDGEYDSSVLTRGLGTEFLLSEVEFKAWPASKMVNVFIEAAIEIFRSGLSPSEIAEVEINVDSTFQPWCEPIEKRRRPDNAAAAANSIPFCVAVALVRGKVELTDVVGDGLNNPIILALGHRTVCRLDDRATAATIKVARRDGEPIEARVQSPRESESGSMPDDRMIQKFADCCSHAVVKLSAADVERIVATIHDLETVDDIGKLAAMVNGRRDR